MFVIAALICSSVGFFVSFSKAAAAMIMPLWQYPHCGTCSFTQAFCSGCEPSFDRPSMVVTLPVTADAGITQERTGLPSMSTVHAPHMAMPQPYLVPVMPSSSRRTHNSGISSSTFTLTCFPLTFRVVTLCSRDGFVRKYCAQGQRAKDGSKDVGRGCDKNGKDSGRRTRDSVEKQNLEFRFKRTWHSCECLRQEGRGKHILSPAS